MYKQSVEEPEKFWATQAEEVLEWDQMFSTVSECVKQEGIVKWFIGGKLNVSSECYSKLLQIRLLQYPLCYHYQKSYTTYRELFGPTCS